MIRLKSLFTEVDSSVNKRLDPRFSVGDRITVIYTQYGNLRKIYPIVEVRTYKHSHVVLYIYQTAPGHQRCVNEKELNTQGEVTHEKTGWH